MAAYSSTDSRKDLLSVTAFLSAAIHLCFILLVTFKLPDVTSRPSTDNTLDVVLLNSSNNEEAPDAEIVSSSNNSGGGEFDRESESRKEWKPTAPSPIESAQKSADQQTQSKITPDQFITTADSEISLHQLKGLTDSVLMREN